MVAAEKAVVVVVAAVVIAVRRVSSFPVNDSSRTSNAAIDGSPAKLTVVSLPSPGNLLFWIQFLQEDHGKPKETWVRVMAPRWSEVLLSSLVGERGTESDRMTEMERNQAPSSRRLVPPRRTQSSSPYE